MSMQDVEITESETTEKPKRKAPARKSRARGASRKRASASRSSKRSNRRPAPRGRASSGASRISPTNRMLRQGRSVMNRAYSIAEEARRAMPRMPRMPHVDLRLPRRSDFDALTDANPLVIGAIGLGLGVVLGTLMPQRVSGRLGELAGYSARSSSSRRSRSRSRSSRSASHD
jgi:hypothetical protein